MGEEITESKIYDLEPDVVCVATGSSMVLPSIPGIDGGNVVLATDVLAGKVGVGEKVVILGGGEIGLETGYHLAEQGKKVTIIEQMKRVATEMIPAFNYYVRHKFAEFGGKLITQAKVVEVTSEGAIYEKEGQRTLEKADTVIVALGTVPNSSLYEKLKDKVPETYVVGDAAQRGKIMNAIHSAAEIAMKI
ncbi:MAG: FAD-dependent oxidoreductase [Candidatus Freyarchaeota archaeon]